MRTAESPATISRPRASSHWNALACMAPPEISRPQPNCSQLRSVFPRQRKRLRACSNRPTTPYPWANSPCASCRPRVARRSNLFMDRDAITDPARFFGRERYFNDLTRRIASHENFGIFGIRKIGKTSLASQFRWNLVHELVGFADAQRFSSSRIEEIYFLL